MTLVNIPLLAVVLLSLALAIAALLSPSFMRWAAARLMARAESLEELQRIRRERLQYWMTELKVEQTPSERFATAGAHRKDQHDVAAA